MIRINLLPFRAARKSENIRRQVSLFFLSIVFVVLIAGVVQIGLNSQLSELEDRIAHVKAESKKYKQKAQKVDAIRKKLKSLEKRRDVIVKLDMNRKKPVDLMEAMTELIVPNRMWLTSLNDGGSSVRLSGVALDNKTTADFMTRLENSQLFSNVTLHAVKHQVSQNRKMKSFNITCAKAKNKPSAKKKQSTKK